jgi:hypothetical protein
MSGVTHLLSPYAFKACTATALTSPFIKNISEHNTYGLMLSEHFTNPPSGAAAACVVAGSFNVVAFGSTRPSAK